MSESTEEKRTATIKQVDYLRDCLARTKRHQDLGWVRASMMQREAYWFGLWLVRELLENFEGDMHNSGIDREDWHTSNFASAMEVVTELALMAKKDRAKAAV
jgi:hypothetical protein